jgi:hypothetical protein
MQERGNELYTIHRLKSMREHVAKHLKERPLQFPAEI